MNSYRHNLTAAGLACMVLLLSGRAAVADDSEVFTNSAFLDANSVRPNILFVVDTSGSMDTEVNTYDPSVTYTGPCNSTDIYWQSGDTRVPIACTTNQRITATANRCAAAHTGMAANGWWRGRVAQINPGNGFRFESIRAGAPNDWVECSADSGIHGPEQGNQPSSSSARWARSGSGTAMNATRWTSSGSGRFAWGGNDRSFYSGNYANWWFGADPGRRQTRMTIVRDVAKQLIDDLEGVNLGIMRYSNNGGPSGETEAEGGMVVYPVSELTASTRTAMKGVLDGFSPAGWTPLSETYYEAHQYLTGGAVDYGNTSRLNAGTALRSVAGSRVGNTMASNTYKSPLQYSCQNSFIVYLTDGLPTRDNSADTKIETLTGETCPALGPYLSIDEHKTAGRCMVNLARYMHDNDMAPSQLGKQKITTYFVGFGDDIAESAAYLEEVATAGGGRAVTSVDAAGLATQLGEIFTEIKEGRNSTFVAPAVAVNAFNRTQNLNELYVSVFAPSRKLHWPGNIKKYKLINDTIVGQDIDGDNLSDPAVDPATGFFSEEAKSFWTPAGDPADGQDVTKGGAASVLGDYDEDSASARKIYTYISGTSLASAGNAVKKSNAALTTTLLGVGNADERNDVIDFARGRDSWDVDKDGVLDENSGRMGDPMHARPAFVIYGGTEEDPDGVVFAPTNDGMLHALDSETGKELWAFIPPEMLQKQTELLANPPTPNREYGLDGDVRILKFDANENGVVDTGDRVYLYFGFARGGSAYYGLDVTNVNSPTVLWRHNDASLPGLAQAWSSPSIARVNVGSAAQNGQKLVLIFGGGYDLGQENYDYAVDTTGNGIYMIDAKSGGLLWRAGKTGANFNSLSMNNSIPGRINVIDTDGDKFADRMYASDMGGRVWRFDIWNGQAANNLVTGGVMARLGAGDIATAVRTDARRMYYAPDVSAITSRGSAPFYNLAIGSGYRGHPLETDTQDRFYSIRDYRPYTRMTQAQYDAPGRPIVEDDALIDITDDINTAVPDGALGWKLELREGSVWAGEKVLGESVTANGTILFTTFTPLAPDEEQPCLAKTQNRICAIRALNGKPALDFNNDDSLTQADRCFDLKQDGIAPSVTLFINRNGDVDTDDSPSDDIDDDDDDPGHETDGGPGEEGEEGGNGGNNGGGGTKCTVGVESFGKCVSIGDAVRTFWQRR
jgi:type IV pilus assembly protein PilY1